MVSLRRDERVRQLSRVWFRIPAMDFQSLLEGWRSAHRRLELGRAAILARRQTHHPVECDAEVRVR